MNTEGFVTYTRTWYLGEELLKIVTNSDVLHLCIRAHAMQRSILCSVPRMGLYIPAQELTQLFDIVWFLAKTTKRVIRCAEIVIRRPFPAPNGCRIVGLNTRRCSRPTVMQI